MEEKEKEKTKVPEEQKEKETRGISRREFLRDAGLVVGTAVTGASVLASCTTPPGPAVVPTSTAVVKAGPTPAPGAPPTSGGLAPALEPEVTYYKDLWQMAAVDVKNGRIVRRRPVHYDAYPDLKPFTYTVRGKTWTAPMKSALTPYALAYKKHTYSPNRILYPLKRVDWEPGGDPQKMNAQNRGKSKYKRISWDEATTIISSEMDRIIKKYGPSAITVSNSPHGEKGNVHVGHGINSSFLHYWLYTKFGETHTTAVGTPVSWEGNAWGSKHVWGFEVFGEEPTTGLFKDMFENTQMLLHWPDDNEAKNWNASRGHINSLLAYFESEVGIKHVYVTPDMNPGVAVHADKWIPVLPNTDGALLLAIAHRWMTKGNYNKDYIATHSVGFSKFEDYVLGKEDGIPKTPAWASPLCGVPVWTIKALADQWASKVTSIHTNHGGGLLRAPYAHEPMRLLVYALAMQGWGAPGRHNIFRTLLPSAKRPASLTTQATQIDNKLKEKLGKTLTDADTNRPFMFANRFAECITNPPFSWYGGGTRVETSGQFVKRTYPMPGKSEVHMLWSDGPGRLMGGNTCSNRNFKAMQNPKLEFILFQQPCLDQGTVVADIILPVSTKHEKYDIDSTNDSFTSLYLEKKCIEPIGEAKSDYEITVEIAKKVGFESEITQGKSIEAWVRDNYEKSGLKEMVSWEQLDKVGFFPQPPDPDWQKGAAPPGLGFYNDPVKNPLTTPSGKIEFYSQKLADSFPGDKERGPMAKWVVGGPASQGWSHDESLQGERAKKYTMLMVSNTRNWGEHQQCTDIPSIREVSKIKGWDGYMYEPVRLHPQDAAKRGIQSGDIVKVYNERGAVLGVADVWEGIIPRAVDMDKGGGFDYIIPGELNRGGSNNSIAPEMGLSQNAQGIAVSGYLVEVEKVTGDQMDEWRKKYPEAFARDYDPAYGPLFSGWIEGGKT